MDAMKVDPVVVRAGDHIVIRMPSTNSKIVCVKPNTTIGLGKFGSFQANALIGQPFGHTFEILKGGEIRPLEQKGFDDAELTSANNQNINDDPQSQKLTFAEIEELKAKGLAGDVTAQEIIGSLTENNQTFAQKTEYSKSKYIQRKQRKFMKSFVPLETTVYNLNDFFFEVNPGKIRGIRVDTLSQVMSLANVYSQARVLVVDDGQGLLVSALLSRIQDGLVFGVHEGDVPNYDILRYANLPLDMRDRLLTLPWTKLHHQMHPFTEVLPDNPSENDRNGFERRQRGHAKLAKSIDTLNGGEFDALVISTNYSPVSVINKLEPYLGGSRMLVVYDPCKEPLLEAYTMLRQSPAFINVQLTESWLREYQVLPNRTHPLMSTSGSGGFILSAIHLASS
ncbi:tRNA (adenine(58)-N(1))-methyltransferase non-catalytic subunit trm6 [Coemansia brasiliensis]|uniref:tRNA (adenine(58)-N(1))-methyltransferase non-catalytic subunit TRM6 n=1 Tax=Coemansia brasiliensis TaxID=2650707 RepID=A0A9W8IB82_9FUNG|nr:tRNA (adenine(58)-N(1))-methyltransferase non-catalytic subunit trm6 [Coemansia brasiliensis]